MSASVTPAAPAALVIPQDAQEPMIVETQVGNGAVDYGKWLKDFCKWKPKKFNATENPLKAAKWLARMEYIF